MKRILLAALFVASFSFVFAQEAAHVKGNVIIQLDNNENIGQVIEDFSSIRGQQVDLTVKEISKPVNIWLLEFRNTNIPDELLLKMAWEHNHIRIAQFDHIGKDRATVPNDTQINSQWQHINTGQTGGTSDSDIDSDEAWDITTGGLTATGDTIVVCILEGGGGDMDHVDIAANAWHNYAEIPNNGLDDDNNGYVDDFDGWDVGGNDDNYGTGNHGTAVCGMIGAVGDNGLGVVGANWDVKMMMVGGFNTQESSVIAAYTYPLVMRQMYNASNGAEGAFVVATNASWGIDQADPNNYPLWCAMYDTLGEYGILNCGATTNSALNVDQVGDMPTACPSDYMVSVTATDDNDVRTFSGYGQTTIDLGAPGDNIFSTENTNSYGNTSGTSFASPLTAGVIGLLYSAPCNSLMALVHSDPKAGADQIRQALFNGTDPKANLTTETVTGGRLNAFNSLQIIMNGCSANGCITPFSVGSANVTDTQADISWSTAGTPSSFNIKYREVGQPTWQTATPTASPYTMTGLTACTDYEVILQAYCGPTAADTSDWSVPFNFTTDGCCEPPTSITVANVTDSTADVSWSSVLAATGYNLRYKLTSSGTWTTVNGVTSPHGLTGLIGCSEYEVQVQTNCGATTTNWSPSQIFNTPGCGACVDLTYCASSGNNTTWEWIDQVEVNTINNTSGADDGYGDYTNVTTTLDLNATYNITLTPGFSFSAYDEYWKVFIDWNQDGDFTDAGETAYDAGALSQNAVTGSITVPGTAALGATRMRVSMKYNGSQTECEGFGDGEVEDYCVTIVDPGSGNGISEMSQVNFNLYPNPAKDVLQLQLNESRGAFFTIYNSVGKAVKSVRVQEGNQIVDVSDLAAGMYIYRIEDLNGSTGAGKLVIQ